jgi:hypothetical protein
MTQSNLDFLNDSLKFLGFGEKSVLNRQLEENMRRDLLSFELFAEAFFDSETKMEAKLYFTRSAKTDFYFFNKYDALLRFGGEPDKDRGQTLYINKGQGITFKESFNLLQGRAVFKTLTSKSGIQYKAWLKLNFAEKDRNGNYVFTYFRGRKYEMEEILKKYNIREMDYEELKARLIRSLQRGNRCPATFDGPDHTGKQLIEANPALSTINIYPMATRAADMPL